MPASIGPIAHLMPESPNRRDEQPRSGRGREFAEAMESTGRQSRQKSDEDSSHTDTSGAAAASAPASNTDTSTASEREGEAPRSADAVRNAHSNGLHQVAIPGEAIEESGETGEKANASEGDLRAEAGKGATAAAETGGSTPDDVPQIRAGEQTEAATESRQTDTVTGDAAKAGDVAEGRGVEGAKAADVQQADRPLGSEGEAAEGKAAATDADTARMLTAAQARDTAAETPAGEAETASTRIDRQSGDVAEQKVSAADTPAPAQSEGADRASARTAGLPGAGTEGIANAAANTDESAGDPSGRGQDGDPRQHADQKIPNASLADSEIKPLTGFAADGAKAGDQILQASATLDTPSVSSTPVIAAGAAASPVATAFGAGPTAPGASAMMAPATMIAAPQEIVDIVSNKLAGSDKPDRIMVQLDPPELGRVSIEFKFDAQGLQQVAVRAETADAMRQLRLMHFDLVQSLEQHGLSARDMTFSEGFGGSSDQQPGDFIDYTGAGDEDASPAFVQAAMPSLRAPITIGASGLNIKL